MSHLRRAAEGQDCQLRLPQVCNFDRTTVVLAHIRRGGVGGMGRKPHDLCGIFACSACHDALDQRSKHPYSKDEMDGYVLDALCRQLTYWVSTGHVAIRA